nr:hypothetical protein [Tanacetum cinerariifolium]
LRGGRDCYPEVEEIEDDNLREKLLNVHLLIANIEALKDNPTQSSKSLTKSSFHNSLPEFENFCFDLEEISSDSTTTHSDISLPDYEALSFNNNHIKEISGGSTTTHSDISLSEYDSFTFDLSNDQCPPIDRSDFTHEEFVDELAYIISPPEYDCFYFRDLPDPGELISIFNLEIRENLSTTCVNLPIEDDHSPLLAYVVWIFLAYLTYPVIPPYLHPFGNEDTIFDPGIAINHFYSFKPGLYHRLLHLAGSQPMLKSSYKAKASVIISIPPLVGGVADVVVEIKDTEMEDLKQQYLDELQRLSNLEYRDEIKIAELKENFNGMCIEIRKKEKLLQEEQWAYLSTHPSKRLNSFCFYDDDDDEDYTFAITLDEPVLSTEEPDNSLSMGDEHLDTILATESDEFIKSGVENLIPIPSESEGIPEHMCDAPFHNNSLPLDVSRYQIEDFSELNEEFSSTDDDSFFFDKIDYVEASPPNSELVSPEVMEIVIPKVGGIKASNDNPILFYDPIISRTPPNLTPSGESDFFLEEGDMLLFEAFLNDDHSSDSQTKSSSTSLNSLLEETNNFDNSLPEFTTFSK